MRVTLLGDISGRVTRDAAGADRVTVAGVCLPSGATGLIRSRLPAALPKWRDATDEDVHLVVKVLLSEALSVTASSVQKTPPAWDDFWRDAQDTHARTAPLSGGTMSFVKAASLIKYALFGECSSITTAHAIKIGSIPRPRDRRRLLFIHENAIFDREIEGDDNVDAFMELWKARNNHQPLTALLGIHWEVKSVRFATEQQEPLLLLSDYIAGLAHAGRSQANTVRSSKVSAAAVSEVRAMLARSPKYHEAAGSFHLRYFDIFPRFEQFSTRNERSGG